ncbi:MAG: hypothetical protein Unbinned306contig1002_42 [Prokaryotic dsDNA virus sp.]|nr:MAG: hypothetical protein Unbinned306contig1002_42 [Prokaryotic dsDNA virus sp.]|tara:strand:- start:3298 stop:3828 length:531 start_codon:yes stop_codon:yes gene_type:complete
MACTLTTGRKLPNKTGFGGVKTIYFAEFGTLGTVTVDADGTISAFSGSPSFFQFDVKGNSSLESTVNSSRENGTTFFAQTINLTLPFLDNATQQELQLIIVSRPHCVVEDYLGNQFLCGLENGCEVTGGTIVTGAAAGDLYGFTLTLEGQEEKAPAFVDSGVITPNATQIAPNSCS